jgi:hypothetical protein
MTQLRVGHPYRGVTEGGSGRFDVAPIFSHVSAPLLALDVRSANNAPRSHRVPSCRHLKENAAVSRGLRARPIDTHCACSLSPFVIEAFGEHNSGK